MHATGCHCSSPGSATEYSPQGPAQKQVQFDLVDDLGNTLSLSADLASFFGDATGEQINTPHPPAPSVMSYPRPTSNGDNQCHATPMGRVQPRPALMCQASLWLPVKPGPSKVHQTPYSALGSGSRHTWTEIDSPLLVVRF